MPVTFQIQGDGFTVDTRVYDAVAKESHVGRAIVTDHPVEVGANISDHTRPLPAELRMSGVVSDMPLGEKYQPGRAREVYQELETFRDNGTMLTVLTKTKTYTNMVILSVASDADKNTDAAISFNLELKNVRIVNSQTVTLAKTTVTKAKPTVEGGKQGNTPADAGAVQKGYLVSITDKVGVTTPPPPATSNAVAKVVPNFVELRP